MGAPLVAAVHGMKQNDFRNYLESEKSFGTPGCCCPGDETGRDALRVHNSGAA